MTPNTKALLLSAAVFPGAGHFFLKKYLTAAILAIPAAIASYLILANWISRYMQILHGIQFGEIQLDFVVIFERLINLPPLENGTIIWSVLITCWLIGMFDLYRLIRKEK